MVVSRALAYFFLSRPLSCGQQTADPLCALREVLADRRDDPVRAVLHRARLEYLADRTRIFPHDLGAGHHGWKKREGRRRISSIARHSSGHPKYHRLLCRLARQYEPSVILETGTALGLGTLALALGAPRARVYTLEGDPALATRARHLFEHHSLRNITLLEGLFAEKLPEVLAREEKIDLAFHDGHHEEEATLRYFGMLLPRLHNNSVVVLDDIHWSKGMLRAWERIRGHERVSLTINLFRMGILFFEPSLPKKTLVVRY
jgi:predicted O-methyltransferase YrrM